MPMWHTRSHLLESTSASFATVFQWLDNTDIEGLNQAIIRQMGENYSFEFERFALMTKRIFSWLNSNRTSGGSRFPQGGANSQSVCANLLFCKFFAKHCMKMKEFGPGGRGAHVPGAPWIRQCVLMSKYYLWFLIIMSRYVYKILSSQLSK